MGDLRPMRSVCYNAAPCSEQDVVSGGACNTDGVAKPGSDLMQAGYIQQWGPDGRDDLGTIQRLGGNAVRLYAALGLESKHDHSAFLDRAQDLGIHVMPGFYTQMPCPKFDCFDAWKAATKAAFAQGFKKDASWHPAIAMVFLQDAPDSLNFGGLPPPMCDKGQEAVCRVRAVLSAMDGLLQAEKEAGVKPNVNLTAAWSFDTKDSIDGKIHQGIGTYGFQDMIAGTSNPNIAGYKPRSSKEELQEAFEKRWTHSINTASPWSFVKEKVGGEYERFLPKPWFLSEFRGDGMSGEQLGNDLKAANEEAKNGGAFLGVSVYSFENDYQFPQPQLYGLFGLGPAHAASGASTDDVCQEDVNTHVAECHKWTVYCLNATQSPLGRGHAVASAWGGTDKTHGTCPGAAADQTMDAPSEEVVV